MQFGPPPSPMNFALAWGSPDLDPNPDLMTALCSRPLPQQPDFQPWQLAGHRADPPRRVGPWSSWSLYSPVTGHGFLPGKKAAPGPPHGAGGCKFFPPSRLCKPTVPSSSTSYTNVLSCSLLDRGSQPPPPQFSLNLFILRQAVHSNFIIKAPIKAYLIQR